jgi:hypothetical protein
MKLNKQTRQKVKAIYEILFKSKKIRVTRNGMVKVKSGIFTIEKFNWKDKIDKVACRVYREYYEVNVNRLMVTLFNMEEYVIEEKIVDYVYDRLVKLNNNFQVKKNKKQSNQLFKFKSDINLVNGSGVILKNHVINIDQLLNRALCGAAQTQYYY